MSSPYLEKAIGAGRWLLSRARPTDAGLWWPPFIEDPTGARNLFWGACGVLPLLCECYHVCGEEVFREQINAGADEVLATIEDEPQAGLYVGVAGMGYALLEAGSVDARHLDGARNCVDLLRKRADVVGNGVDWPAPRSIGEGPDARITDLVFGNAGAGLFLLRAAKVLDDPSAVELSQRAARRLVEVADRTDRGFDWYFDTGYARRMPNFSHGTSGIVYFLASQYMTSGEPEFLEAALEGGRFLQSIAWTDGKRAYIQHNDPPAPGDHDNPDIRYTMTWSHGPIGTGWAFYRLFQATGDPQWLDWLKRCACALLPEGVPEEIEKKVYRPDGYSWIAGRPAEGNFFLDVYRVTGDGEFLDLATERMDDTVSAAVAEGDGFHWAADADEEHRWCGLMQGPAGIGLLLSYMDSHVSGRTPRVVIPDNPFWD